jgi:peptidoglycan/xylan/chitin deacetylase (PgdA/CDA1 family)
MTLTKLDAASVFVKRVVILLISCGLFLLDFARRVFLRLIGKRTPGTCVVLAYHGLPDEQRARFARQMDILRSIATPIRADNTDALAESKHHVAVTFDDGLTSFAQNALPELEKRDIPVLLFVVTDRLGTVPAWTTYSRKGLPKEKMLAGEELQRLSGKVLIGSHGCTHPMLTELDGAGARHEIADSRRHLEALVGCHVTMFSFPYGAFNEELVTYCRNAGYGRVFSALPVLAFSHPREFVTGRVTVEPTDWPFEFRLKASGSYRWLPYAFIAQRELKTWMPRFKQTQKAHKRMTPSEIGPP